MSDIDREADFAILGESIYRRSSNPLQGLSRLCEDGYAAMARIRSTILADIERMRRLEAAITDALPVFQAHYDDLNDPLAGLVTPTVSEEDYRVALAALKEADDE